MRRLLQFAVALLIAWLGVPQAPVAAPTVPPAASSASGYDGYHEASATAAVSFERGPPATQSPGKAPRGRSLAFGNKPPCCDDDWNSPRHRGAKKG